MKKIILSLVYAGVIGVVGLVLFLILSNNANSFLYDYKPTTYSHEIDSLFQPQALKHFRVRYTYKSGERGSIYYINIDSLSKVAVIESTNYSDIFLKELKIASPEKIDLSQAKTYTSFMNDPFPLVQQALNPRESSFLKISFEKPCQLEKSIKNEHFFYLRGNFAYASFGNSQNCSIVTFQGDSGNEVLIIKRNGKLYFILQTVAKKSLLEIVNPALLATD